MTPKAYLRRLLEIRRQVNDELHQYRLTDDRRMWIPLFLLERLLELLEHHARAVEAKVEDKVENS